MYVCSCFAVTDTKVQETIDAGAVTVDEVTQGCKAGGDCGACRGMIEDMLEASAEESRPVRRCLPQAPSRFRAA